jgi:hypothetical protein
MTDRTAPALNLGTYRRHTATTASRPPRPANSDPLLQALTEARRRRDQADQEMRTLIALAREFTTPKPYRLTDLATASGLSTTKVRTSYGLREITYLQAVLSLTRPLPDYLQPVVTALRHQPHANTDPDLVCGHCGSHDVHITDQHPNDFNSLTTSFACQDCGETDTTWTPLDA